MAIPFGKKIPCSIVVSPNRRGYVVIETKGRQASRQLERLGWTQKRSIWLAPEGWHYRATVIYPFEPMRGKIMLGYRFYDTDSERNVTICTSGHTVNDEKQADIAIRKMGWRMFRGQWRAPS